MSASKPAEKALKPLFAFSPGRVALPSRARQGSAAIVFARAFERGILE